MRRIIDGDTFQCEGGSRVRLLIADADEVGQSVYADSATLLLRRVMPVGSTIGCRLNVAEFDRYRRVLAFVYASDVVANRELVRRGYAQVAVMRAAADSAQEECSPLDPQGRAVSVTRVAQYCADRSDPDGSA